MFKNLEPLDTQRHAKLRYQPARGYDFARGLKAVPLSVSETVLASRDYPVVFSEGEEVVPMALLSTTPESSPYIDDQGQWRGGYVPAHIRRYPFILGKGDNTTRMLVMIDRDAPQFTSDESEGQPLFVDGVIPEGGIVFRVQQFLTRFESEMRESKAFLQPLADKGLLVSRAITLTRDGKSQVALRGFRVVDADALGALDAETAQAWLRSGLLGQVFAHLHSLHSVGKVVAGAAAG